MIALIPCAIAFGVLVPGVQSKIYMVVLVLLLGWITTTFFRQVVPRLRSGPIGYTIDDAGIHGRALLVPSVAWEDVVRAELSAKRSSGLIELMLTNYEKYIPPELLTARHRLYKEFAPLAMGAVDVATGDVGDIVGDAGTALSARGDSKDVRSAARDISDGLLRVPTRGFDHSAKEVLAAINVRLVHVERVRRDPE